MAYAGTDDLERRVGAAAFVQLADDDGDGVADAAVVAEALAAAEGEVNGYLGRHYKVPIDLAAHGEVGDLLKSLTLDLAEYRLRIRRPPVSDDARRRHAQTLLWLIRLAAGTVRLPVAVPIAANPAGGIQARAIGEERLLTRRELENA